VSLRKAALDGFIACVFVNYRIRFIVYGVIITLGGALGGVYGLSGAIAKRIING
jgi:hypothetical protein